MQIKMEGDFMVDMRRALPRGGVALSIVVVGSKL